MHWDFTTYFTIAVTVLILGVDVILVRTGGKQATISDHMRSWNKKSPMIAVLWGCLMWHFFGGGQC